MNEVIASLFSSLVSIFVLMMIGLGIRRLGLVGKVGTDALSKAVIYCFFPLLVFHRIALTDEPSSIFTNYIIHIWAVVLLFGSGVIGLIWHRIKSPEAHKPTFIFTVGMPNWIYLPLAIAGPMWGDEAVRLIILFNIPTQFILWTAGIWILHGSMKGMHVLRYIILNPGLLATVAGILTAFGVIPITFKPDTPGIFLDKLNPVLQLLGGLTIPLSIVALGLYLGEKAERREGQKREVLGVTLGRLIIAPIILGALIMGATVAGVETPQLTRWVLYLIICMPVAMSVPLFVQMFGGDAYLSSRSVVFTTLAGLFTTPLYLIAVLKIEIWLGLATSMVTQ